MIPATASVALAATTEVPDGYAASSIEIDSIADQIYTGTAIEPAITVKATLTKADADPKIITLTTDDYNAVYDNNIDFGTAAKVTVTGKEGTAFSSLSATKTFKIGALNLASTTVKVIECGNITKNTQDGIEGKLKVYCGPNEITANVNMTVDTTASTADMVVVKTEPKSANTNVTGSRIDAFNVKKSITGATVNIGNLTYTGNVLKPSVSVTKDSKPLVEGTDYTVSYSPGLINAGPVVATITGTGKYYGSVTKTFSIEKRAFSNVSITIPNVAQGSSIAPVVKDGDKILVNGTDYYYVDPGTSVVGSQTIDIIGTGNYTGKKSASFSVIDSSKVFNDTNVTAESYAPYYNGSKQYQTITVAIGNTTLRNGADYKVEYTKNGKTNSYAEDAGTYTVTVTGIGSYSGSATKTFTIREVPLDYAEIVLGSSTVLYNGVYVPKVTVKHAYSNFYFKESDYTVTYRNVGSNYYYSKPTAVVTVKTGGNLTTIGSTKTELTKEFSLASRNLSNCTVTFTDSRSSKNYDGNASFKPPVTVKDYSINKTLTENLDYKITYKDAAGKVVYALKDAGTYSVIVEGINAYTGTRTLTFTINGTDISGYTVTLKDASVNATGYAQTPVITSVKKGYYYSLTSNDYTVSYQDSTGKTVTSMSAPGTYKVVVTGKNGYSGSTYATFKIVGLPQTVTVTEDSYKVYATSESFKITAKASGDATGFTYTSSNPAVASVSSTGYVTMHKVGRAVITVTTTGMKKYEPASETVEVKVYPKKAVQTKKPWTDGKKYQAKVRWTYQEGATSYQVRYSRDKNFGAKTYKTKTVKAHGKDYTTQSTTLTSLKSKSTYYIKVRAVYTDPVTGDTYYGAWSGWRSVKTK